MDFYFSTNEKWYSRLHRRIEPAPVTHMGIGLFTDSLKLVIDCTKPYGKLYHLRHWSHIYDIVHTLRLEVTPEEEKEAYYSLEKACVMTPYDWGAYYYAWIVGLCRALVGRPYPEKNKWAGKGLWCSEIPKPIKSLLEKYNVDVNVIDWAAQTPFMVWERFRKSSTMKEIEWAAYDD